MTRAAAFLARLINARSDEVPALLWSFLYAFCLLGGYYVLRPVRDEMGIAGGVDQLHLAFTGTFLAMLVAVPVFAWLAARLPRRRLLPTVYAFFIVNIAIFYVLFLLSPWNGPYLAWAFFIWVSVFNLFVVSVFWSFMADLYTNEQSRRLFGFVAAGASTGAVVGPAMTALLAPLLGPIHLLPLSAAILAVTLLCIARLLHRPPAGRPGDKPEWDHALGGGVLEGMRRVAASPYLLAICGFIWLYTTLATFLYFQQAYIIDAAFDDAGERTRVFAIIDFLVNTLTVALQIFVTGRFVKRFGMIAALALVPLVMIAGFAGLAAAPVLGVLIAFQVARRAGHYAISRPAREMLFTVVARTDKYKSKNFIDTLIYRAGDALSGWAFAGLTAVGLGLTGTALIALPAAVIWLAAALYLGRRHEHMAAVPASPRTR